MSVVAEVLEREIRARIQRVEAIQVDLQAIAKRIGDLGELGNQMFIEIKELDDALQIERDHIERSTEVLSS